MYSLLLTLFFSHHAPEQEDHCWRLPIPGGRSIPICARCTGIYPVLLLMLFLQLAGRVDLGWSDPWLILLFPLPAVIEFLAENLGVIRGSNPVRIATGLPLGFAMSRMFVRYFQDVRDPLFWGVVLVYGGTCGLAAVFALRRRLSAPSRSPGELPGPLPGKLDLPEPFVRK